MSDADADKVGIKDNDWVELVNRNGVVASRHRHPPDARGDDLHAARAGPDGRRAAHRDQQPPGGIHQLADPDRDKPTIIIGGYAQLPTSSTTSARRGNNRDEVTVTVLIRRRANQEVQYRCASWPRSGDGDEPDKCIGCHLLGHLQAGLDQPRRHRVRLVQQCRDPSRGLGYPRGYEDQEEWKGGWVRTATGRLAARRRPVLQALSIFSNLKMPSPIHDYYEPWTYDYDILLKAPARQKNFPVARPY